MTSFKFEKIALNETRNADVLSCPEASDKNTNEGSQEENVSAVVLIDLTDAFSVSRWRGLVAQHFDQTRCCLLF